MPNCGTITVESAFDESAVSTDCSVVDSTITEGADATVSVSVTNNNNSQAAVAYTVQVDGDNVQSDSFTAAANSSDGVDVELTGLAVGEHTIDVTTSVSEAA